MQSLLSGHKWDKTKVTFSFPDEASDYGWFYGKAWTFQPTTNDEQQAVRFVLEGTSPFSGGPRMSLGSVAALTNLSFEYKGRDDANIRVGTTNADRSSAYQPNVPFKGGDVWLARDLGEVAVGTHGFFTVLHELGHALGLKHAHDSGSIAANRDSIEFTVMTYRSFVGGTLGGYTFEKYDAPQTFMMYDIAALQHLYGADFTTNNGNTVYHWSTMTGETFVNGVGQGAPGGGKTWWANRVFLTIWDGNGIDTYDFSNYRTSLVVDLTPGGWSKLSDGQTAVLGAGHNARGNVFNAFQYRGDPRSLIENANGGSGSDRISGNAANNELVGNGGLDTLSGGDGSDWLYGVSDRDTLNGGDGDDVLDGGTGADRLVGGAGFDYASYATATAGVRVSLLEPWANTGEATGDVLESIEGLHGSAHGDTLGGSSVANYLFGRAGDDLILDQGGDDHLFGEAGDDYLVGGGGGDRLDGGAGWDIADYSRAASRVVVDRAFIGRNTGEAAGDSFVSIEGVLGSAYGDQLHGDAGYNELYGNAGNDVLEGRGGGDFLKGGDGFDYAVYWSATAGLVASLLNRASNSGDAAGDLYDGIEGLQGSAYGDILQGNHAGNELYGHDGNDMLKGEGGADYLVGGAGNDTLQGEGGADHLVGGAGHDRFRFDVTLGSGNVDEILDFNWGDDLIQLSRNVFTGVTGGTYLDSTAFKLGTAATTAAHRIIYNNMTGELFYDADGSGWAAGQVKFAVIKTTPSALDSYHFLLV